MSKITVKSYGNFSKTYDFLERFKETFDIGLLDKYGKMGVEALKQYTPKDTGLTSESWYYKIERQGKDVALQFLNSNTKNGWANVAILLQYGHATKNGVYVQGIDYINPALGPIFEDLANEAWREVIR